MLTKKVKRNTSKSKGGNNSAKLDAIKAQVLHLVEKIEELEKKQSSIEDKKQGATDPKETQKSPYFEAMEPEALVVRVGRMVRRPMDYIPCYPEGCIDNSEPPPGYDPYLDTSEFGQGKKREDEIELEPRPFEPEGVPVGTVTEFCSAPGCTLRSLPGDYLCEHHVMLLRDNATVKGFDNGENKVPLRMPEKSKPKPKLKSKPKSRKRK